jgi:hypothetical protein
LPKAMISSVVKLFSKLTVDEACTNAQTAAPVLPTYYR